MSLHSIQGVLKDSFVQGHNKLHGQQNTLKLLEKARDARNEDIYKKFKEDERERLKTGVVEADEDQLYDDTHVLDELSKNTKTESGDASIAEKNGLRSDNCGVKDSADQDWGGQYTFVCNLVGSAECKSHGTCAVRIRS